MSHVATVKIIVKDLSALRKACPELGLEFREGQTSFKWYGRWMNDYNAPEAAVQNGFDPKKFGQCEHAIGIKNNPGAYEVGVVKNPTGEGYTLLYDNYCGGMGLEAQIGKGATLIKQAYAAEVARKQVMRLGYRVQQQKGSDGKIRLVATR